MEMIDVLDPNGAPTGVVKPKPDVHRDGDWHRSVHIWIFTPDDRVLVQRRALTKENNPGLWDVSCAGHVASGETPVDAAIREVQEELGLKLSAHQLRHLGSLKEQSILNDGRYIENEFHEIYEVRQPIDLSRLALQAAEVHSVRLVTRNELRALDLVPHDEEYTLIFGKPSTA